MIFRFAYAAILGTFGVLLLFNRKKRDFQSVTLQDRRNHSSELIFTLQLIFVSYISLGGQRIDSSIIKIWVAFIIIILLVICYKEYRFRYYRTIYYFADYNTVFADFTGEILTNNNLPFEKEDYSGWTKDGIKFNLIGLPQELFLFIEKAGYTHVNIVIKNYRMEMGSELIDMLMDAIKKEQASRLSEVKIKVMQQRNSLILGIVLIMLSIALIILNLKTING